MFSRSLVFCLKIWRLWKFGSSNHPLAIRSTSIFCWNFAHVFFCLDLEFFAKIKKELVSTHSVFWLLLITQHLNKIRKITYNLLSTLLSRKRVLNFSKKAYGSLSSSKLSIFQTKSLFLLEIIEVCLNLGIGFWITWLVIPTYKKNGLQKPI